MNVDDIFFFRHFNSYIIQNSWNTFKPEILISTLKNKKEYINEINIIENEHNF